MAHKAYGSRHQKRRRELLPKAYGKPCPRCGEPMLRGQDLDLGHTVDKVVAGSVPGDRVEHMYCNRGAGGAMGNRRQRLRPSRAW